MSQFGIITILVTDIISLVIAVGILLTVRFPIHKRVTGADGTTARQEMWAGFKFLVRYRGLLILTLAFTALQFFGMMVVTLLAPMILARTGDEAVFGLVSAATGAGGVLGATLMTALRPPRRFALVVGGGIVGGSTGFLALGLSSSPAAWVLGALFGFLFFPIVGAASAALKQRKTPLMIQGRVFAADQLLQMVGVAAGILAAGPLADLVFERAFVTGASWTLPLVPIFGSESGSGMSALIVTAAIVGILTGLLTLSSRRVRTLEDSLPDSVGQT